MNTQSLAGQWQFRQAGTDEWLPATVPGGVHTDLLALGTIPDPFVGDNEKAGAVGGGDRLGIPSGIHSPARRTGRSPPVPGLRRPGHPGRCLAERQAARQGRQPLPPVGLGRDGPPAARPQRTAHPVPRPGQLHPRPPGAQTNDRRSGRPSPAGRICARRPAIWGWDWGPQAAADRRLEGHPPGRLHPAPASPMSTSASSIPRPGQRRRGRRESPWSAGRRPTADRSIRKAG